MTNIEFELFDFVLWRGDEIDRYNLFQIKDKKGEIYIISNTDLGDIETHQDMLVPVPLESDWVNQIYYRHKIAANLGECRIEPVKSQPKPFLSFKEAMFPFTDGVKSFNEIISSSNLKWIHEIQHILRSNFNENLFLSHGSTCFFQPIES